MIAATSTYRYPQFDLSEITPDHEYTFRSKYALKPIRSGDAIPDFTLEKDNQRWQQFFNGVETHGPVLLRQLLNKPLAISFYSGHWRAYGLREMDVSGSRSLRSDDYFSALFHGGSDRKGLSTDDHAP